MNAPEWLTKRGGTLRPHSDGESWAVVLGGTQQYLLTPIPVAGKHGCRVLQTINGKRLNGAGTYATRDEALEGGLEALRHALGW